MALVDALTFVQALCSPLARDAPFLAGVSLCPLHVMKAHL